ncbi:PucR family transcriptional regulator [Bacillus solimangrovi]|uniref:PucR family transcriptional regulator n=1 Tax=Bacillus solimangrovi TaxID=1305675 RepID=A0A1E5LHU6_9BACI|nr:PucR family transcriptional regulator [Bacillus solimangrovi]OEH93626.1 hypothetical protein BFG57_01170 [Bacillus solimangrovi]
MITIKEMLNLPLFQSMKCVAGKHGQENLVRWLVTLELLDDIDHLQEGELLLTTAYDLHSHPEMKHNLIQKLSQQKLSGIMIQTGYYLEHIPDELIQAAEHLQFPIIEIPKTIPFSSITRSVHQQIMNSQFTQLKYSQEVYEVLTEIAKNNEGLISFAQSISSLIQADIAFFDNNFNKLCSAISHFTTDMTSIQQIIIEESFDQLDHDDIRQHALTENETLIIKKIHSQESIYGYLIAIREEPLTQLEEIAVNHTATIAALEFIKLLKLEEKDIQLKADFLELVLTGNYEDDLTVYSKAEALGYNLTPNDTCVAILKFDNLPTDNEERKKTEHHVQQLILKQLQDHAIEPLFKRMDQQLVMLLTNYYPHRVSIQEMLENVSMQILGTYEMTLSIGIGNYYHHFHDYRYSYKEAQEALYIIKSVWKNNKCLHYGELGLYKLLLPLLENKPLIQDYYESILGGVIQNEKLLETLYVYLEDMRMNNAAETLFIHRHTLKYRINKIEELTKRRFDKFQDRVELELALIIHQVLGGE